MAMKRTKNFLRAVSAIALMVVGQAAFAQYGNYSEVSKPFSKVTPTPEPNKTEIDVDYNINPYRTTVGFLPLTSFTLGGSFGTGGGTLTTTGSLISLSQRLNVRRGSVSVGGFVFYPYERRSTDASLYGLNANYFFGGPIGLEVQYLNLFNGGAPAATAHLLFNLTNAQRKPSPPSAELLAAEGDVMFPQKEKSAFLKQWTLTIGVGGYFNFADELVARQGGVNTNFIRERRSTAGFSSFLSGSVSLSKDTDLVFSQWIFRDRSSDIGRFSLGVSWHF